MLIVTAPVATSAGTTNERTTELSVTRLDPIYYLVDATPLRLHRLPRPIGVTHSALPAWVVLHIDDHPVTQAQDMRVGCKYSAAFEKSQFAGGTLIFGTPHGGSLPVALTAGFQRAFLIGTALVLAAALIAFMATNTQRRRTRNTTRAVTKPTPEEA